MIQLKLEMAGIPFEANCLFESTAKLLRDYQTDSEAQFSVTMTREELAQELIYAREAAELEHRPSDRFTDEQLEYTAMHRLISEELLERNVLLFHGSALAMDGEVYLFTAPSGTGKSTHARYWRRAFGDRVSMVNDDKPFLRFLPDGRVLACGSPWRGKHGLGQNIMLPLRAVCLLGRGETNRAERISADDAFTALFRQCFHSPQPQREIRVLSMLNQLGKNVRLYRLWCNMSIEAAQTAYAALQGGTI